MMNTFTTKIMFITFMFGTSMGMFGHDTIVVSTHHMNSIIKNNKAYNDNNEADINVNTNMNRLRGYNHIDIIIDGDVQLKHLLQSRRLGPIPESKAIMVPCHNATSNCGIHGTCRISGKNKFCHCDAGYSSFTKENPCAEKGKVQLILALMQYLFGYTGGPAFALGWTVLGVSTLLMFCCGICCTTCAKENDYNQGRAVSTWIFGALCSLAAFGLWIYTAIKISTDCVDKHGTPCKSW